MGQFLWRRKVRRHMLLLKSPLRKFGTEVGRSQLNSIDGHRNCT
jgi:hypothetical protein